jgi:hypothetical protein
MPCSLDLVSGASGCDVSSPQSFKDHVGGQGLTQAAGPAARGAADYPWGYS